MTSSELKSRVQKSIDFLQSELSQIRTGRANPSLLEDLVVVAYEAKMTLKELGTITLMDSHTILITPWDKSLLPAISKAISESEQKLNPIEAGSNLKVPIPALTEDRRKELVKIVNQKVEETKQAIRNIRQEAMKDIDRDFDAKTITEDDKFNFREKTEDVVREHVEKADEVGDIKSKELLTV